MKKWLAVVVAVVACIAVPFVAAAQTAAPGMSWADKILGFVNDPQWKFLIALGGGQLLRFAPWFENKAIPFVLQIVNVLTVVLGAAFGVKFAPGAVTAWVPWIDPQVGQVAAMGLLGSLSLGALLDAVASVALASGVQSQIKNAAEWWRMGRIIVKAKGAR